MTLKIIGAGFGRTGTMSLRDALIVLGYGPCYHMAEVLPYPERPAIWANLARGGTPDWEAIFAGYVSALDWPMVSYWKELADHYPEAKVILTLRDPEKWFESTYNTIFNPDFINPMLADDADPDIRDMMRRLYTETFDGKHHIREHAIKVFTEHNEEVKATIAPERLLVFEVKEGWEPLCKFLGEPVPPGTPFPHANSTEDWLEMAVMARGGPSAAP